MTDILISKIMERYKSKLDLMLSQYELNLRELLSISESPIESLMILKLFDFFGTAAIKDINGKYLESKFTEIEFIEECFEYFEKQSDESVSNKIDKYRYRFDGCEYCKVIGLRTSFASSEPILVETLLSSTKHELIFREIEIYPQKVIEVNNEIYRTDIAMVLHRKDFNNKTVETKRLAIECDGHKYHSTPEQIENDNIRQRKLKASGWDVVRYSGREIHNINDIEKYFNELMKILFSDKGYTKS